MKLLVFLVLSPLSQQDWTLWRAQEDYRLEGKKPVTITSEFTAPVSSATAGALHFKYSFEHLRSWTEEPPKRISVRLNLPQDLAVHTVFSLGLKPACIGRHSFHFEAENAFLPGDIEMQLPAQAALEPKKGWKSNFMNSAKFKPMETVEEWETWRKSTGEAQLTCHLTRKLDEKAGKELKAILKGISCVTACGKNSIKLK